MQELSAMQRAMVKSGLIDAKDIKSKRKRKGKQFNCRRCGTIMTKVDDSNIMYCKKCGQYFLFDTVK